jgi:hypothetical protein
LHSPASRICSDFQADNIEFKLPDPDPIPILVSRIASQSVYKGQAGLRLGLLLSLVGAAAGGFMLHRSPEQKAAANGLYFGAHTVGARRHALWWYALQGTKWY